jgi:hypothetical protein
VGLSVGWVDGRVTTSVGELRLWLPAASTARICTTCWPLSSLNQRNRALVSAVVATSKPLSQMRYPITPTLSVVADQLIVSCFGVTFSGSMSETGWGGSESLLALVWSVLRFCAERLSTSSELSLARVAADCEGSAPDRVLPGASSSPGTKVRSPVLEADSSESGRRRPATLFVGSSFNPERLICSGERAMPGTRYRDPTPRVHTPKTISRLIVTACIRLFYGPGEALGAVTKTRASGTLIGPLQRDPMTAFVCQQRLSHLAR